MKKHGTFKQSAAMIFLVNAVSTHLIEEALVTQQTEGKGPLNIFKVRAFSLTSQLLDACLGFVTEWAKLAETKKEYSKKRTLVLKLMKIYAI